jgi:hypothetical protein
MIDRLLAHAEQKPGRYKQYDLSAVKAAEATAEFTAAVQQRIERTAQAAWDHRRLTTFICGELAINDTDYALELAYPELGLNGELSLTFECGDEFTLEGDEIVAGPVGFRFSADHEIAEELVKRGLVYRVDESHGDGAVIVTPEDLQRAIAEAEAKRMSAAAD